MAEMMNENPKWVEKKDYGSKSATNTALGLSIGALGLELLKGNGLNLGNILGGNNNQNNPEETAFGLYKGYRDADDAIIAKHNIDSFALYKNQRDEKDNLQKQIDELKTKMAIQENNSLWQFKNVNDLVALEAERRQCNDNKIVNYVNTTFAPKYIADFTIGSGTTQQTIFNPLCNCMC